MEIFSILAYVIPLALGTFLLLRTLTLGGSQKTTPHKPKDISDEMIKTMALEGSKINAIKLYRIKYQTGLKEAKEAVESLMQN